MRAQSKARRHLAALAACGVLVACNGQDAAPAPSSPTPAAEQKPAPQPAPAPAPAAAPVVATPDAEGIVRITANDQMRFSATRIEVKAADTLKIELTNVGTLPKEAMGHNLVVLKPGNEPSPFAQRALAAKATDYVPADAQDVVVGATRLLGPGEKQVIEITLPGPGTYPFLCSFPGHVALMNGQIVAQ